MNKNLTVGSMIAIILCVTLTACTISQVVESLDLATTAATVAVDVLGGSAPAAAVNYLTAVNNGITCTTTVLQSGQPAAQQALSITACFATAIAPALPPGTSATVVTAIAAVSTALAAFLAHYTPSTALALKAVGNKPFPLTRGDHRRLGSDQKQASKNLAKLKMVVSK